MSEIRHIHHILPKHQVGTDDPENLVSLTIEEHAEAHRLLYEKYGRQADRWAWQGLAKLVDKSHLVKEIMRAGSIRGGKISGTKRAPALREMNKEFNKDREHQQRANKVANSPIVCDICGHKSSRSQIGRHKLSHHNIIGYGQKEET